MRDKIIEVLKSHETNLKDHNYTPQEVIRDWEYKTIADEIEKLFESHIKTGVVNSGLMGTQAIIDAGCQLVSDFVPSEVKND